MKKVILAAIVIVTLFSCKKETVQNEQTPEGSYIFRVKSVDMDGSESYSKEITVTF